MQSPQDRIPQEPPSEEYLMGVFDALDAMLTSPLMVGELRRKATARALSVYRQIMKLRGKTPEEIEEIIARSEAR